MPTALSALMAMKAYCCCLFACFLFIGCVKGDAKIPGETEVNPLKVKVKNLQRNASWLIDKKYLLVSGVPWTAYYSWTYKQGKTDLVEDADRFYFPIVSKKFDAKKDKIAMFGYVSNANFKKLTKNFSRKIDKLGKNYQVRGKRSAFLYVVPDIIVEVFRKQGMKIASNHVTIRLTEIKGYAKLE